MHGAAIKTFAIFTFSTRAVVRDAIQLGVNQLAVVTLTVPPLRERPEDIELLTDFYVEYFSNACAKDKVKIDKDAKKSKSNVVCDALILDERSRSDTYPYIEIDEQDVSMGHEASVSRIGEEQLFYLTSRGLTEAEASTMIVSGFIEPLVKELPMEYAVEMNRLIELQMEGSVG